MKRNLQQEDQLMKIDTNRFQSSALNCAMDLCKRIRDYGHEAYIVGGSVRDMVRVELGQTNVLDLHDVDIATNMPIDALKKNFRTESNNGEAHGTILVFNIYGYPFEVTQFRTDGDYSDGRHPDTVAFTRDFKEDAARRDFTINAMGMDGDGNVIDPFNGIKDIYDHVLRAVGEADKRFKEDSLRILRGARFAVNFGYEIEPDTYNAMKDNAALTKGLSNERIRKEIAAVKNKECGFQLFLNILSKTGITDVCPMFEWIDLHALHVAALRAPSFGKTSVFVMMTMFSQQWDRQAELCLLTREEKKQLKWYKRFLAKRESHQMSWIEMVQFVKGDWETFLSILDQRELPDWAMSIPEALQLAKIEIDQTAISDRLKAEGYEPGPVFGDILRGQIEKIYQDAVNRM